jgi:CheY-like chemotaxis protein
MDVLLVDSVPLVRHLAAEMLEDAGLALAEARDAATALAAVTASGTVPGVLVVALRPAPGGVRGCGAEARALAEEIGRRCGGTAPPPLLYTGESRILLGDDTPGPERRFLEEPYGPAELVRAVLDLLGRPVAAPWLLRRARRRDPVG